MLCRWGLATMVLLLSGTASGGTEKSLPERDIPAADTVRHHTAAQTFRIMTYNVENLFDTCHYAGFSDEEFLPDAQRHWNTARYWSKQQKLSRTIVAACGDVPLDVIALCEVENDTVVDHLCRRTRLRRLDYAYIVTHSNDARGIDVALLYQPIRFRLLHSESLRIPFDKKYGRPTRDILHACGRIPTGDTLDVFVCHMPSRRGGTKATRNFRFTAIRTLRQSIDSISRTRRNPLIVALGDFNDEYTDASIRDVLQAKPCPDNAVASNEAEKANLYVLSAGLTAEPDIHGTYKYRGQWNQLDQIIVNKRLLSPTSRLQASPRACYIFAPPFLTERDGNTGSVKPFRTYLGPVYHGGISDHFPVIADFIMKKE